MASVSSRGKFANVNKAIAKTALKCSDCGEPYLVYRSTKRRRKRYREGHEKNLWCYKCKAEKVFVQLDSQDIKYNF